MMRTLMIRTASLALVLGALTLLAGTAFAFTVSGTVRDQSTAGLGGVTVEWRNESTGATSSATTASNGAYSIALAGATYTVKLTDPTSGTVSTIPGVSVTSNTTRDFVLVLGNLEQLPAITFSGHVDREDTGGPAASVQLYVYDYDSGQYLTTSLYTNANGDYSFTYQPPVERQSYGRWRIYAYTYSMPNVGTPQMPSGGILVRNNEVVTSDLELDFTIRTVKVSGTLSRCDENGNPATTMVDGVPRPVPAQGTSVRVYMGSRFSNYGYADASPIDGHYEAYVLQSSIDPTYTSNPASTLNVQARALGYCSPYEDDSQRQPAGVTYAVDGGNLDIQDITYSLCRPPVPLMRARVVDADGAPIGNVEVQVYNQTTGRWIVPSNTRYTERDRSNPATYGTVCFGVSPGTLQVWFNSRSFDYGTGPDGLHYGGQYGLTPMGRWQVNGFTMPTTGLDVGDQAIPTLYLRGRTDPPAPYTYLYAYLRWSSSYGFQQVRTDADGNYEFGIIPSDKVSAPYDASDVNVRWIIQTSPPSGLDCGGTPCVEDFKPLPLSETAGYSQGATSSHTTVKFTPGALVLQPNADWDGAPIPYMYTSLYARDAETGYTWGITRYMQVSNSYNYDQDGNMYDGVGTFHVAPRSYYQIYSYMPYYSTFNPYSLAPHVPLGRGLTWLNDFLVPAAGATLPWSTRDRAHAINIRVLTNLGLGIPGTVVNFDDDYQRGKVFNTRGDVDMYPYGGDASGPVDPALQFNRSSRVVITPPAATGLPAITQTENTSTEKTLTYVYQATNSNVPVILSADIVARSEATLTAQFTADQLVAGTFCCGDDETTMTSCTSSTAGYLAEAHTLEIDWLDAGLDYACQVCGANAQGLRGCSDVFYGTTLEECDMVAPTQSGFAYNVSDTRINVTWASNEACTGQVAVNGTALVEFEDRLATSHSVGVAGLSPQTEYQLSVSCTDTCGNIRTQTSAVTTLETRTDPDTTPPTCTGVVSDTGESYVVFSISCDEPSTVDVLCSDTTTHEFRFGQSSTTAVALAVSVTSLSPGHSYQCGGSAKDAFANQAGFDLLDVTTPATVAPMVIRVGPTASVSSETASITWRTGDASGGDRAGTTELRWVEATSDSTCPPETAWPAGNINTLTTLVVNHASELVALAPSTSYCYKVRSVGIASEVSSAVLMFKTLAAPVALAITGVDVETEPDACEDMLVSLHLTKPAEVIFQVSTQTRDTGTGLKLVNPITVYGRPATADHTLLIGGLTPGVAHYYSVLVYDADGFEVDYPGDGAFAAIANCGGAPNLEPVIVSTPASVTVQCTGPSGANVTLNATVRDPYGCTLDGCPGDEALACDWVDTVADTVFTTTTSTGATAGPPAEDQACSTTATFGIGTYFVRLDAREPATNGLSRSSSTFQVTVRDQNAPCVNAGPDVAWPASASDCTTSNGARGVLVDILDLDGDGQQDLSARPVTEDGVCGGNAVFDTCDDAPTVTTNPPAFDAALYGPTTFCVAFGTTVSIQYAATDSVGNKGTDALNVSVADLCTGVDCSDHDSQCTIGVCDPADGICDAAPRPDLTPCDDGQECTVSDVCRGGLCGGAPKCDYLKSPDTCTLGVCDPTTHECSSQRDPDLACNHAPIAQCVQIDAVLDASGTAVVTANAAGGTSIDPDGDVVTLSLAPASFTCADIGAQGATLTASDFALSSQCSATVNVIDGAAPTLSCPADVATSTDTGACGAAVSFSDPLAEASDNCAVASGTQLAGLASGAAFPLGATTQTFQVSDPSGLTSTCSFQVTVTDEEPPAITCPADVAADAATGTCEATVSFTAPAGTDNCAGATTAQTAGLASGAAFPLGATTQGFTTTDAAGHSASCSFAVTVADAEPPTLSCPADASLASEAGACGAAWSYAAPVAADNCAGVTTAKTAGLEPGATFPVGTTTQDFLATDAGGNTAACTFAVTVTDEEAPTITCPADLVVDAGAGCAAVVTYDAPAASDNCAVSALTRTAGLGSGGTFPVGDTTEAWTATDAAGHGVSCSFKVSVVATDADGDGVTCVDDSDDGDATVCRDADGDSCDDCASGVDDAMNDGPDLDGDGACDAGDGCVADPAKTAPGICGCNYVDAGDADGDGVLDCVDVCPDADDHVDADMNGIPDGCDGDIVIVDNDNANNVASEAVWTSVGEWTALTDGGAYRGGHARSVAGVGTDTATFTAFLPQSGRYNVWATWTPAAGNANNAPFTITNFRGRATTVRVDQSAPPSGALAGLPMQLLGEFEFKGGRASDVTLSDSAGGPVFADGVAFEFVGGLVNDDETPPALAVVRFVDLSTVEVVFSEPIDPATDATAWTITDADGAPLAIEAGAVSGGTVLLTTAPHTYNRVYELAVSTVYDLVGNVLLADTRSYLSSAPTVIVDNPEATCQGSNWSPSTTGGGFYGADQQIGTQKLDKTKTCTYSPVITVAGRYQVSARWGNVAKRATNASYEVSHTGGTTTVTTNQAASSGVWVELGVFDLAPGEGVVVLKKGTTASQRTVADAIRYKPFVDFGGGAPETTFTSPDGTASLTTHSTYDMYLEPVATPADGAIALQTALPALTVVGTAYDVGPSGWYPAGDEALLTITYDDADLPEGTDEATLSIYTLDGATWVALTTVARDTDANTLTALVPHQSLFAILTGAAGAVAAPVAATDVDVAPHRKVDVYRPPAFVAVSFRLPAPYDVADIAGPVGVDGVVDAISVSSADGVATVVFDGQALLDLEAANVTTRSHVLRGVLRARPGDLTPPAFDRVPFEAAFSFEVASSLSTSTIHFHGNKPRAKFEGDMLLTIGELPEDFRSGATAGHGSLRLTLGDGSVLAYDNPDVGFTLSGVTNPRRDEKWQFKGPASKEEMTIRWDSAPTYDATNDPGLPRSVGSLRSEFIATDETSLTIDFRKATLPLTVVVDGVVLATIRTDRSVVTALPAEIRRTTATVLFPARLVPGVVIAWYRDGDTSDGVQDLVYTQECAADGTRSATYNNGTARYSVSVPIPSDIDAGDLAANAVLSFTIGEPGVTAVSEANIDVAYRVDNDHGDIDWLYRPAYQWGGILDWLDWLLNLLAPDLHDHGNCHGSH